ncbi:helix-turn-helix domain-containing protein [Tessaracoccus coleopterorum]|uniref:helix-turn-helix domain-containing protein n=1 Tax=Tessaracoccus coleopterorum TaxID=2714950 RepID=UPI0018D4CDCF|nr:TetR/AcrR family transcriptional regulator [Tessaracoccus coleopterorum]
MGRRDRNKAAKRAAISRAAARLFAEQGFAATTTQQVAVEADVAEGTLFRYAGTKQELLLMVVNEHLRPLVGLSLDAKGADPEEEILLLLGP